MRRALLSFVAIASSFGCSLVKNADDVVVGEGVVDAALADSGDGRDTLAADSAIGDSTADVVANTSGDTNPDSLDADTTDTAVVDENRSWALWPMPSLTPSSYDTTVTDVVIDTITKLRWQKVVSSAKKNAADAELTCKALTLGGTGGWRLPTRIELVSLLAFSPGIMPAINSGRFPGTPAARHWTASRTPKGIFVVDFGIGSVGFALETELLEFRCVHSP